MKKFLKRFLSAVLASAMIICIMLGASIPNSAASKLPGDVNTDGYTDNKDVVVLFRYLSGDPGSSIIDVKACDTNGDGKTNNKDVTALFRHLNDGSVAIYYGVPVPDNVFILDDTNAKNAFISPKQTTVSKNDSGVCLKYNKPSSQIDPSVTFNISKYAASVGKPELTGEYGAYIAIKAKADTDGYMEVFTHAPAAGDRSSATYIADGQFHYFVVDMTNTTFTQPEKLSTVRLDWTGTQAENGATMTISEIGFFKDLASVLDYTKLKESDVIKQHQDVLTFPQDKPVSDFLSSTSATISEGSDNGVKTAVITSKKTSPSVFAELRALAEVNGNCVKRDRYVAVRLKLKDQTEMKTTLKIVYDVSGIIKTVAQDAAPDCKNDGWQGVLFDIRDIALYETQLSRLRLDFTKFNAAGSVEIGGIAVTDDLNTALEFCGHSEYCINTDGITDNDELADTVLTAENEDSSIDLWFDQSTQKTNRTETQSTGRTGYTVRMAKNEAENCQFFISPEKTINARIEIEDFKNSSGDKVQFETFYEFYHNINNTMIPDALPPLTGAVTVSGGESQGFVIQLTTLADTPAGTYNSVIHVYDNDTGKEVKRAAVAVKVWDFELSEKTELRTAFALWGSYVLDSYNWNNVDFTDVEVMDNYFEFFLKYRINIMDNPHGLTSGYANRYMSQDRVNTARWTNLDMSIEEDNDGITPVWKDKVIYYPGEIDEPRENYHFSLMKQCYDRIKANTSEFKMVAPFERNLNLTADGTIVSTFEEADMDQIEYMSRYLNIWCPKLDAFTTRDLGFIARTSFLQSEQQDAKYGTFIDRMKKEVDEGDELWAYVCINPTEPYANWQLLSDGTETVISIWQMKDYDVTGMLYWSVDYWKVSYWNQSAPWTGTAYGDGFLIYSGYAFGLPTPISSLRLENIRDGIEDYQMLCMLEEALGKEAADEMIDKLTTSIVTFATNDDYVHAVRVLLGDTLEAALSH